MTRESLNDQTFFNICLILARLLELSYVKTALCYLCNDVAVITSGCESYALLDDRMKFSHNAYVYCANVSMHIITLNTFCIYRSQ